MRVLLTGAAGFVGGGIARTLRERGDDVLALVRDPKRAPTLEALGVERAADDLSDVDRLVEHLAGVQAAIHAAGSYRVGVPRSERGAMWDANVGTTTRLLDAAEVAGTKRVVYLSTVNVYGNTRGEVVDEAYRRNLADGFVSWYDETKYGAHEVAEQRIADRDPIVIVLPSQVYGPRDHSEFGDQLRRAHDGNLAYRALDDVGVGLVHIDDLAAGVISALDHGAVGESYVLSGPHTRLADAIGIAAAIGGRRSPPIRIPTGLLKVLAPIGPAIGRPNLAEVISAADGVTYWASADKATRELGFSPREIESGLRDTFAVA